MRAFLALTATLFASGLAAAQSGNVSVDARANLFGYGVSTPAPAGGGGGVLAPVIALVPGVGRTATFAATGSCAWGAGWPASDPDGGFVGPFSNGYDTNLSSGFGPISEAIAPRHGHVWGVFIEAGDVSGLSAPLAINYGFTPTGNGNLTLATYSPALRQVFFIGDGLTGTGSGTTQSFNIPDAAAVLVLGVADGINFIGPVGSYDDNTGSFSVNYQVLPEPGTCTVLAAFVAALLRRRR